MRPLFEDLRLLKLAEHNEIACESFLIEIALHVVDDEHARHRLLELQAPLEANHERIVAELARLNANLSEEDRRELQLAALADVVEVEEANHAFYQTHGQDVQDPAIRELFRRLSREGAYHALLAREELARLASAPPSAASGNGSRPTVQLSPRGAIPPDGKPRAA